MATSGSAELLQHVFVVFLQPPDLFVRLYLCAPQSQKGTPFQSKKKIIKHSPDAFVFNRSEFKCPPKAEEGEEREA